MTAPCKGWRIVAQVDANQSSRFCFTPDGGIFRIIRADGAMVAPGLPRFGTPGLLVARPNLAHVTAGRGVRMDPMSGAR